MKYYAHLGMNIDYDSDCEDSGITFSDDENQFDALRDEQDDEDADRGPRTHANKPAVYQTIPGTENMMKEHLEEMKERQLKNERIINGTEPLQSWSSEWLKARWRVLEMSQGPQESSSSCSSHQPWVTEPDRTATVDEEEDGETPWRVSVRTKEPETKCKSAEGHGEEAKEQICRSH